MQAAKKRRHQGRHAGRPQDEPTAAAASEFCIDSELVARCLRKWSWGRIAAAEVQAECYSSYKDFSKFCVCNSVSPDLIPGSLHTMAQLGVWGKHSGNCHRDLLRKLGSPQSPEFIYAEIWCKSGKPDEENNTVREISFPLMPPHVLLDYLFTNHRARFDDLLFGEAFNEEKLEGFWRTVTELRDPRLKKPPYGSSRRVVQAGHPDRYSRGCSSICGLESSRYKILRCLFLAIATLSCSYKSCKTILVRDF